MSKFVGKPIDKAVGRVLYVYDGDCTADWDYHPEQADIQYCKTVDLTDAERDTIMAAINTPEQDAEGVEITPAQSVDLDCFSAAEITTLSARGPVASGLGGTITNANFIITTI